MMRQHMSSTLGLAILGLGCIALPTSGCASTDRTVENDQFAEIRERLGEPGVLRGQLLDTGKIFGDSKLYLVRATEVVPCCSMVFLMCDAWEDISEREKRFDELLMCPSTPEFTLFLVDGERLTYVEEIADLRWRVKIETEEDAARFADLIGLPETASFFADCRGWEVTRERTEVFRECQISSEEYEELGLPERSIKPVHGGYIIRRPLFVEATESTPRRLIISSEYISHDGLYLFAVEKEIAKGRKCPISVLILDNDLQRHTYRGGWSQPPVPVIGRQGQEGRAPVID